MVTFDLELESYFRTFLHKKVAGNLKTTSEDIINAILHGTVFIGSCPSRNN